VGVSAEGENKQLIQSNSGNNKSVGERNIKEDGNEKSW